MAQLHRVLVCMSLALLLAPLSARAAAPNVHLTLQADVVTTVNGKTSVVPVHGPVQHSGVLRYTIVARNAGSPAYHVEPAGQIPQGTAFSRIVAMPAKSSVLYTLDRATWSAHPTIVVVGKDGKRHRVPAPLTSYRGLRWVVNGAMPHDATFVFSYEVRVK